MSSNKLKIRYLSNLPLFVSYGGFEHQCVQTIHYMRRMGIDSEMLTWGNNNEKPDILHLFGLDITWSRLLQHMSADTKIVLSVLSGGSKYNPTKALFRNSLNFMADLSKRDTIQRRYKNIINRASAIVCLNVAEQEYLRMAYKLPSNKIHVVPNGVPESRFCGSPRGFEHTRFPNGYVLFVGSITARKNPVLLASILKKIGVNGVFIGGISESELSYGEKFKKIINCSDNLLWVPRIEYDAARLDDAYAGARLFCLPSVSETQPLSALEAMAAGVPVLLGNHSYAEQSPFEKCYKTESYDADLLGSQIHEILTNQAIATNLPLQYQWASVASRLNKIYESI